MPQARNDQDNKTDINQPPQGRPLNQVGQGGQGPGQFDQHGNLTGQSEQEQDKQDKGKALRPGQTASLAQQEQEQSQKRQQDAWEEANRREKDNNPATKDWRAAGSWYTKENQPGLHPANQPDPDSKLNKGTRLDLEDLTGNPGHRGVNPDAPANSINPPTDPKTGRLESINEPPGIEQNWSKAGERQGKQGKEVPAGGSEWSINEPPGSQVIPEGAGEGSGGGQVKTLRLDSISPTETQFVEGVDTVRLTATGEGFDDQCVIVFDNEDQETEFVSETELTASVPYADDPGEVDVLVSKGDEDSQTLKFTFNDTGGSRSGNDKRERESDKSRRRR